MSTSIDDMLSSPGGQSGNSSIDALLSAPVAAPKTQPAVKQQTTSKSPVVPGTPEGTIVPGAPQFDPNDPRGIESAHGLISSLFYGPAQDMEHIPVVSQGIDYVRGAIRSEMAGEGWNPKAESMDSDEFDKIVNQREIDYQNARTAAGRTGFDWWNAAGMALNPLNYMGGGSGAARSILGRIGQGAGQGALMGAETPSNTPGSFWQDKIKNVSVGTLFGGGMSAVVEGVVPLLNAGVKSIQKLTGNLPDNSAAAEQTVNQALNVKGIGPTSIPQPVINGMKAEVKQALDSGANDISPRAILNQSVNNALPYPYKLTRGMVTEDPSLRTQEYNLSTNKSSPQGAALTKIADYNNIQARKNLDALGANAGHDEISTGLDIQQKVKAFWDSLTYQKDQLYNSVKNSQGLSALVDGKSAAREIRETLKSAQGMGAWNYIPPEMKSTLEQMENGDLPMTVSTLQNMDKMWGQDIAGASGATAGSVRNAIGQARTILGKANIQDDIGQDSMKAYALAKQAHAQQMSMVTPKLLNDMPNPNYQPLLDDVIYGGIPPEKIFQKHFIGEAGSVAGKNAQFLSTIDPEMPKVIGQTLMNHIQSKAIGNAATDSAPVSEKELRNWAGGAQKSALMENLLPDNLVQTFRNFSRVHTLNKFFPAGSSPNMSGTAGAMQDFEAGLSQGPKSGPIMSAIKQELSESSLVQGIADIPGVRFPLNVLAKSRANQALNSALNPDVTLKSMVGSSLRAAGNKRTLAQLMVPPATSVSQQNNKPEK